MPERVGRQGVGRIGTVAGWTGRTGPWAGLLLVLVILVSGCSAGPPPLPDLDVPEDRFSTALAQAHLDALASLGPRWPGSRADELARDYLTRAFRRSGATVETLESGDRRHLVAGIEGESADLLLLVAPYPLLGPAEWVDDAGAVLLLELARLLGAAPPPYTVRLALAETRPRRSEGGRGEEDEPAEREEDEPAEGEAAWIPVERGAEARERVEAAGRDLAAAIGPSGLLGPGALRAVIAFEPRARAELRFARDLRSHPVFRDVFWETAGVLGYEQAFPPNAGWSSPGGLHAGLGALESDLVLALAAEGADAPELAAALRGAEVSALGLEPLGRVTVEALARLMRRFEKVDAFGR